MVADAEGDVSGRRRWEAASFTLTMKCASGSKKCRGYRSQVTLEAARYGKDMGLRCMSRRNAGRSDRAITKGPSEANVEQQRPCGSCLPLASVALNLIWPPRRSAHFSACVSAQK